MTTSLDGAPWWAVPARWPRSATSCARSRRRYDPVVEGGWLHAGQHVNAVGARPRPTHRELDGAAMARGTVFVDSRATAWSKSGDLLEAVVEGALPQDLHPTELGEVIAGRAAGRVDDDQVTVFDSVGLGAQDLAVAALVLEVARERGLGTTVPTSGG